MKPLDLSEIAGPNGAALLVIDAQNDFCHSEGIFGRHHSDMSLIGPMLKRLNELVGQARRVGVPVIWVKQTTEPDGGSDSAAWLRYKTRDGKSPNYTLPGTWGHEIVDALDFRRGDMVFRKYRSDSFLGTPLERFLRGIQARTVVITGVNTEGCVDATLRSASFRDYYALLVEDCVGSFNPVNHDHALSIMRSRHDVITSTTLVGIWNANLGVASTSTGESG